MQNRGTIGKVWLNCPAKGDDVVLETKRRKPVLDAACPKCGKTVRVYNVRLVGGEYVGQLRQHGQLVDPVPRQRNGGSKSKAHA